MTLLRPRFSRTPSCPQSVHSVGAIGRRKFTPRSQISRSSVALTPQLNVALSRFGSAFRHSSAPPRDSVNGFFDLGIHPGQFLVGNQLDPHVRAFFLLDESSAPRELQNHPNRRANAVDETAAFGRRPPQDVDDAFQRIRRRKDTTLSCMASNCINAPVHLTRPSWISYATSCRSWSCTSMVCLSSSCSASRASVAFFLSEMSVEIPRWPRPGPRNRGSET